MSQQETAFGRDDVIAHLGVRVVSEDEAAALVAEAQSTGMVQWRAAPTLVAIGNDLDRVAATTSAGKDREGARRRWNSRRVNVMKNGERTNIPLIVRVTFVGRKCFFNSREDREIGQRQEVEGLGEIDIRPLFTVGIDYVTASQDGTLVPTRMFYGVLYAPANGKEEPYKFVPLELTDLALAQRWNLMVDQGALLGTVHGGWKKIEIIQTMIGRPGMRVLPLAPRYQLKREFPRMRGKKQFGTDVIWVIDTRFGKQVILDNRSQDLPVVDAEADYPFGNLVFRYTEHENSIVVTYLGREGEVDLSTSQIDLSDIRFEVNPFDTLNMQIETYDPRKARRFVQDCLRMKPCAGNPLYERAVELQLVSSGLQRSAVVAQLSALAQDALECAETLYNEAFDATLTALRRYDPPSIEVLLAGNRLNQVVRKLNPDDEAAKWVTSHIEGEYRHRSPFHRALREALLRGAAKRANYLDPEPEKPAPVKAVVLTPDSTPETTAEASPAPATEADTTV